MGRGSSHWPGEVISGNRLGPACGVLDGALVKAEGVIVEHIRMRKSTVGLLGGILYVAAACSGATSDPLVANPGSLPDSNSPASAVVDDAIQIDPESSSTSSDSSPPTSQSDELATDVPPPVPIADSAPAGTFIRLEGEVLPLIDGVISNLDRPSGPAFADGSGGLVFQPPWGVDQTVFYLARGDSGPSPMLDVDDGRRLLLWGASSSEAAGQPRLLATVVDKVGSEDEVTTLLWWDSINKAEWIAELGGPGTVVATVDHGENRFVVDLSTAQGSSFVFLDSSGQIDELASNPKPLCKRNVDCRRLPTLAPGGGVLAYHDPIAQQVVVVEIDLAEEIVAAQIPPMSVVTSLDLSQTDLVINHSVGGQTQAAFVIDLTDERPRLEQLPVPGDAFLGGVPIG